MRKHARRSDLQPKRRPVELCIISAQALKKMKNFGRMRTYAVAYIDPSEKISTHIDAEGGSNPTWDEKIKLWVEEDWLEDETAQLTIEIYSHGTLRDKLIGTVRIFLADAVKKKSGRVINKFPVTSYLIFRPSGGTQGILNICIPPTGIFPQRLDSLSFKSSKEQISRRIDHSLPSLKDGAKSSGDSLAIESFSSDSEEDAVLRVKLYPPPAPDKNHLNSSSKV